MPVETKFLRLRQPMDLEAGESMVGACAWLGGWDRQRMFYVVMVLRVKG